MGKKMLQLPPSYFKNEDYKTGSTETEFMKSKMENYETYAPEMESEEIDELAKEVGRIFYQESAMKEKGADSAGISLGKAMRYLADMVLNIFIMLLPILLSIMTVGFLIKGGKAFWYRLIDLWGKTGNRRNPRKHTYTKQ